MARIKKNNSKVSVEKKQDNQKQTVARKQTKTEELIIKITIGVVLVVALGIGLYYLIQAINHREQESAFDDYLIVTPGQVSNLVKASRNDGSGFYDDIKDSSESGQRLYEIAIEHEQLDFYVLFIEVIYSNTHVGRISRELESTILQLPRNGFDNNHNTIFLIVDLTEWPQVLTGETIEPLINDKGMGDIQSPLNGGPYLLFSTNRANVGEIDENGEVVELNINGISQSERTIETGKFSTTQFKDFLLDNILG